MPDQNLQGNPYPSIFSTPLFCQKFSLDNKDIKSYCLHKKSIDSGKRVSNVGGYQSNDYNLKKPPKELKEISKCILDFSYEICNFLNIEYVISGNAWINVNQYGHFNWLHTHPECILSGVYYVSTPNKCGNIEFENPLMSSMTKMRIKKYNIFNASSIQVPSEEGTMYIFPSWLPHKVHPNLSNEDRISISFNLI